MLALFKHRKVQARRVKKINDFIKLIDKDMKRHNIFLFFLFFLLCSCSNILDNEEKYCLIMGETFSFHDTNKKQFLYPVDNIESVYTYEEDGEKIYHKDANFILNKDNNSICRTINSLLPNITNYKVNINSNGLFTFVSEPRNPPLIRDYVCYINYYTKVQQSFITPANNSFYSIIHNNPPKIAVCGDSIALAAQTYSRLYHNTDDDGFSGLLRSFLITQYSGGKITVDNYSEIDSSIDLLLQNMNTILENSYNAIIIEYGMNDHLNGTGGVDSFTQKMSYAIKKLQEENIYVVLVGFFQENEKWDLEAAATPQATILYNKVLSDLAIKYSIPFIDIYSEFFKISQKKDLINDFTVDWMHHPTEFGHKVYFSMIVPYFIDKPILNSQIDGYVLFFQSQ